LYQCVYQTQHTLLQAFHRDRSYNTGWNQGLSRDAYRPIQYETACRESKKVVLSSTTIVRDDDAKEQDFDQNDFADLIPREILEWDDESPEDLLEREQMSKYKASLPIDVATRNVLHS